MMNIYWLRGKIGDAIWLWLALMGGVQAPGNPDHEWWPVVTGNAGNAIGDGQLGQAVLADGETVIAWRTRLESLGMIRKTLVADQKDQFGLPCHTYEVVNLAFGGQAQAPLAPQHVN